MERDAELASLWARRRAEQRDKRVRCGRNQLHRAFDPRKNLERYLSLAGGLGFVITGHDADGRGLLKEFGSPCKRVVLTEIPHDPERPAVHGDGVLEDHRCEFWG